MVVEPHTSPPVPYEQPLFAGVVGVAAALLPIALPSLALIVALLTGNVVAVVMRRVLTAPSPTASPLTPAAQRARRRRMATAPVRQRWPTAYRVTAASSR